METQHTTGFVIWLTGMNRAGKSTLAAYLSARLAAAGRPAELLDEDGGAAMLLQGLGSSKDDRARAVARLGFVAKAVMRAGGVAVVAALSPYRDAREQLRKEARRFVEVFVDCSMEKLQERDPQGIYRRALAGELREIPGVDVPYEPPTRPEVTVHSDQLTVEESGTRVFQGLVDAKYLGPTDFGRLTGGQRPKRAKPAKQAKAARAAKGGGKKKAAKAPARKATGKAAPRAARAAKARR